MKVSATAISWSKLSPEVCCTESHWQELAGMQSVPIATANGDKRDLESFAMGHSVIAGQELAVDIWCLPECWHVHDKCSSSFSPATIYIPPLPLPLFWPSDIRGGVLGCIFWTAPRQEFWTPPPLEYTPQPWEGIFQSWEGGRIKVGPHVLYEYMFAAVEGFCDRKSLCLLLVARQQGPKR